ncbi:MAG: hypothetical protein OEZ58_04225 [Gammaproteobacteria bacterium]|nr:hypothetical protein [Gammaproteobacteria bacterium]MDH5728170.1 hypothetical protein [Gammaproteobacteria bacterium]
MENLLFALLQMLHNVGAVSVSACPLVILYLIQRRLIFNIRKILTFTLLMWLVQLFTGIGFGITSYQLYGHVPDLESFAKLALILKISCLLISIMGYSFLLFKTQTEILLNAPMTWQALSLLGLIPLLSAAVLRWYV